MNMNSINTSDVSIKDSSVKSSVKNDSKSDSLSKSFSNVLQNTSMQNNTKAANTKDLKSDSKSYVKNNTKTVDKKSTDDVKKMTTDSKGSVSKEDGSKSKKIDKTAVKKEKMSDKDKKVVDDAVKEIISLLSSLLNTSDIKQTLNIETTDSETDNNQLLCLISGEQKNSLKNLIMSLIKNGSDSKENHESLKLLMADNNDIASLIQSNDKTSIMDVIIKTVSESLNNTLSDNNSKAVTAENILNDFKNLLNDIKASSSGEAKEKIEEIVSKIADKVGILEAIKEKLSQKADNHLEMSAHLDKIKEVAVESGQQITAKHEASVEAGPQITAKHEAASDNNSAADYQDNSNDSEILNKLLDNKTDDKLSAIANRVTGDFKQVSHLVKVQEAPSINRATINEDIIKSVKFMQNNSIKELTVKVNPGTLGEITIRMVAEGDTLKANIHTANKETYNLINSQEIKNVLNTENIKVTEVNISLYNEDTTFFRENGDFSGELSKQNNKHGNRENDNYNNGMYASDDDETQEDEKPGISRLNIFV